MTIKCDQQRIDMTPFNQRCRIWVRQLRYRLKHGILLPGLWGSIPADWQGKMLLAHELGVPLYGLPYRGSNESLLLDQNGRLLDERICDELARRRDRIGRWFHPMKALLKFLAKAFAPASAW